MAEARDDEERSPDGSPAEGAHPGAEAVPSGDRATPITQQLGRLLVVVLLATFVVFALDNAQHVDFSWLVGGTEVTQVGGERVEGGVRLIVLLLGAFGIGALVGGTIIGARARAKRKAAARD